MAGTAGIAVIAGIVGIGGIAGIVYAGMDGTGGGVYTGAGAATTPTTNVRKETKRALLRYII